MVSASGEGRATGVVDRTPPVHNVQCGCITVLVDSNEETTRAARYWSALDLSSLCKRVVGILCKFQQHTIVSVTVTVHQFVDPPPKELLMLARSDEVLQAVKGLSFDLARSFDPDSLARGHLLALPLRPDGLPENFPERFTIADVKLLKCERQGNCSGTPGSVCLRA